MGSAIWRECRQISSIFFRRPPPKAANVFYNFLWSRTIAAQDTKRKQQRVTERGAQRGMSSNKSTTGRGKGSSAKKTSKKPIPIDGGASSPAGLASSNPNQTSRTQDSSGIEQEIRLRAYELFVERGRQNGHHHEDWTRAEIEILAKYNTEKSA
jgi:hypothetical protein